MIPDDIGLEYQEKTYDANVNRLSSSADRDRFAGTLHNRHISCKVKNVK